MRRLRLLSLSLLLALTAIACGDSQTATDPDAGVRDTAQPDASDVVAVSDVAVDTRADAADTGATDTAALPDTGPTWVPQTVDDLFAPDRILEVAITLAPADWDTLRMQSRTLLDILGDDCLAEPVSNPFTWFPADVTIDGVSRATVGVRKKGFLGSLSPIKPSLKLKMDEYVDGQRLAGAKRVTLNNAQQDPSYINQCLTYGLFTAAGLPTPRCSYARVTVNGLDLGLYVHVESIKKPFLAEVFGDDDGDLYEGALSDFRTEWLGTFEKKTNESEMSDALSALSAALELPDDALLAALDTHIDTEQFIRFWALEVITGHWDGYANNTNNFYLYRHPDDDRFRFIVWGADATFEERVDPDTPVAERPPVSVRAVGLLARRLYQHPEGRVRYEAAVRALLDDPWDATALRGEAQRMRALLTPHVAGEERARFDLAVDARLAFITARRDAILAELDAGTATWDAPLRPDPCWETIGTLSGTLTTQWDSHDAENPLAFSSGTFEVTYDDTTVPVVDAGATIGAGSGEDVGNALFRGIAVVTGGAILVFQVTLPLELVAPGTVVPVDFRTAVGVVFQLPQTPGAEAELIGYVGDGTMTFTRASLAPGGTVEATFDLSVISPF